MSAYSYCSKSQYPQRAAKRMIGFQIFCYRHKYAASRTMQHMAESGDAPKFFAKDAASRRKSWKRWNSVCLLRGRRAGIPYAKF